MIKLRCSHHLPVRIILSFFLTFVSSSGSGRVLTRVSGGISVSVQVLVGGEQTLVTRCLAAQLVVSANF